MHHFLRHIKRISPTSCERNVVMAIAQERSYCVTTETWFGQHDENLTPCCNGNVIWTTWEKCSQLPRLILLSPHGANVSLLLLKQMWFRPHGRSDSYMKVVNATAISALGSPSENNNLILNGPHLPSNRHHLYLNMVKEVSNLFTQATPLTYIVQLIN